MPEKVPNLAESYLIHEQLRYYEKNVYNRYRTFLHINKEMLRYVLSE